MSIEPEYITLRSEQIELVNSTKSSSKLKLRQKFKSEPWFFKFEELPKNWLDVNILDVTWLVTCGVAKKPDYVDEGIPFLSAQNARPFKTNLNKIKYIREEQFKTLTVGGKPEKNDILYTRVGNCGEAAKIPYEFDFAVYVSLTLIKPIHELIDSDYLVAYLNSQYGLSQANVGAIGSGLKNLNVNNVRRYRVPLPPLPEQQRIVAKLDGLFAHLEEVKTRLEKVPQLLKDFRQSVLTQAVTGKLTEEWRVGSNLPKWKQIQLEKVGAWSGGGTPSKSKKKYWTDGTIPWITPKDMKGLRLDSSMDKVTEDAVANSSAKLIDSHSILVVTRSGILRRILPVSMNVVPTTVNQDIKAITPNDNFDSDYLLYALRGLEEDIRTTCMKSGTTVESVETKLLKEYSIGNPSIVEQTEIVSRVDALFSKVDAIQEKYTDLKQKVDNLPQAILAKAFKGELVEQLESDGDAKDLLKEIEALKAESEPKKRSK